MSAAKDSWPYHVYSVWLFTRSDLKTIVVPQSTFGILTSIALSLEDAYEPSAKWPSQWAATLSRGPLVFLWVWINLLPFAIDNQRQAAAIMEDRQNKPWRPLPSGRMTPSSAHYLMMFLYPTAFCVSLWLGGVRQCTSLMVLGYMYNDLDLADLSWISRNVINALGFCSFASGALEVAAGFPLNSDIWAHRRMYSWLAIIAGVVFSTVQTQDMADQDGDRLRGRKSMPLALGDSTARWLIACATLVWSLVCPWYWSMGSGFFILIGGCGSTVACRTLLLRRVQDDVWTFRVWNLWLALLYTLPLVSVIGY